MDGKQVGVKPIGIYYICPHCKNQMRVEYQCGYCPNCGGKLLWDNVKEYKEITSHSCWHEDTDDYCKHYKRQCNGSANCAFCINNKDLNKHCGKLTSFEKEKLLREKGYA